MAERKPWFIRAIFRIHAGALTWQRFDAIVARGLGAGSGGEQ